MCAWLTSLLGALGLGHYRPSAYASDPIRS